MNAVADWRADGVCGQTDPELFFSDNPADQRRAKALCESCRSLLPCKESALANGDTSGVQGGMTAEERKEHPGFTAALPVRAFAPETDAKRLAKLATGEAKAQRRRQRAARLRESEAPAMDGFDLLTHPFDQKGAQA